MVWEPCGTVLLHIILVSGEMIKCMEKENTVGEMVTSTLVTLNMVNSTEREYIPGPPVDNTVAIGRMIK